MIIISNLFSVDLTITSTNNVKPIQATTKLVETETSKLFTEITNTRRITRSLKELKVGRKSRNPVIIRNIFFPVIFKKLIKAQILQYSS